VIPQEALDLGRCYELFSVLSGGKIGLRSQLGEAFPADFPKEAKLYHGLFGPPPPDTSRVVWAVPLKDHVGDPGWLVKRLSKLASGGELGIIYWFNS
jgi:hypothetical protein